MRDVWKQGFVTAATIIIMMIGFWLVEGREYVSRDEMHQTIESQLSSRFERVLKVEGALERNTEVINELKIQLAVLNETLKHIQHESTK